MGGTENAVTLMTGGGGGGLAADGQGRGGARGWRSAIAEALAPEEFDLALSRRRMRAAR